VNRVWWWQESARSPSIFPLRCAGSIPTTTVHFMNETLQAYCRRQRIEWTRSRAYLKNDQAWVEQKNGAVVRRLAGYGRLRGLAAAGALQRLYESARLYVNFFQPSFKLASKQRDGALVRKRYHPPLTPYQRLVASERIDETASNAWASNSPRSTRWRCSRTFVWRSKSCPPFPIETPAPLALRTSRSI
jgi:hypothetical protein